VTPPPVPVIVMGYVPVFAERETVRLKCAVPEPGAAIDAGLKLVVTPEGTPDAESAIAELKLPLSAVVTVAYPLWPWSRYPEAGETEMVKLPATGAETVRLTVVVSVVDPDVPVIVILYVPVAVVEATANVAVELPDPVIDIGLNVTVTPAGWPLAVRPIAELNPPVARVVIVEVPELPCTTETDPGEAETLNPGVVETEPASAFSKLLPFGLPHPVARSYPMVAEKPLLPLVMSWKSVV